MQEHPPQDSGGYGRRLKKKETSKGFTLVELIVVIVILAILAAILIPGLLKWIDQAKDKKYELEAREIVLAAEAASAKAYADSNLDCDCGNVYGEVYWYKNGGGGFCIYNWMKVDPLGQEIEKLSGVGVKYIKSYASMQTDNRDVAWAAKNFEIYFVSSDNAKIYARYFIDSEDYSLTDGWEITKDPSNWDSMEGYDWN